MLKLITVLALLAGSSLASAAPVKLSFWHALNSEASKAILNTLATEFNRSQSRFEIAPVDVGDYGTLTARTVAALRSGGVPAMAMVDNGFFTRLAVGGQLAPLTDLAAELPRATVADFYPVLWEYGEVGKVRYGLPWAASTLLLYYNADALRARNIAVPKTWDEFGRAARALTNRASKGAVLLTDGWQFSSFVAGRGGDILKDDRPNFDSPEAVATLQFFQDLVKANALVPRNLNEINLGVLDFLRTKAFMAIAPSSAWPVAFESSVVFKMAVAPVPGRTLPGEAQLVAFKGGPPEAPRAAFEFWQYVTRPENVARWVKASAYLPVRRSAVRLLGDLDPQGPVAAGLEVLEKSFNLPRLVEFNDWRVFLEAAMERSLKAGVDPKVALAEAQRQSLAVPRTGR